ncbi:MAG: F0F1 ATP synthase subunit A [Saccharofermentans sp.]|nr:F0F1 ATP synthase subunit A [Saccharofermentans sp.]
MWFLEFLKAFWEAFVEEIKIGDIGEEINKGILQWQHYFEVDNIQLVITDAIIVSWIAIALMILLLWYLSRGISKKPNTRQTLIWLVVDLILKTCRDFGMSREQAEKVAPMIMSIGAVIMGCNVISVFKISPPAKNIAFPAAMAVVAIIYVLVMGIRFVGLKGFVKYMTSPMPALLPFKILDFIIKPVSLTLRLFGNVFGAFVFMEFLYIIVPAVVPGVIGLWFDIGDGIIQAVVFSYLTMSYIGEIVETANEPEDLEKKEKKMKKKAEKLAKKNSKKNPESLKAAV